MADAVNDIDTRTRWQKAKPWLVRAFVALLPVLSALATHYGVPPRVIEVLLPVLVPFAIPDESVEPHAPPPDARFANGWVQDDDEVKKVVASIPQPVFANTPAGKVVGIPDSYYLWDVAKSAIGRHVPTRNQLSVGSCVAFGSACAVEYQQCVARVTALKAGQPPPEFKDVAQEIIYGGSRYQIGGNRLRGDGSVGAWGAQWCQKYGSIARGKYDGYDLTKYTESQCRAFGAQGCPKSLEAEAKKYPTRSISQVRTVAEAKAAIANGYPVTVASSVGFGQSGPYTRNAKGQLRASGTWPHQMCFIGYDKDSGLYCMNSWGETWVGGPAGPGNPPPGGFYVDEATAGRMLGQDDSWAYGDQVGFPARTLNWDIRFHRREFARLFTDDRETVFALAW